MRTGLLTLLASNHHGQDAALFFLLLSGGTLAALGGMGSVAGNQVGEGGVFQNASDRVAHIEEDLIERAVRQVAADQHAEFLGIGKGRERAINQAHDLAQTNVGGIATKLVAPLGSAYALDHARVL